MDTMQQPEPEMGTEDIEQPNETGALNGTGAEEAGEEQPLGQEPEVEEAPFPKKAVNALNRRDRRIRQLQAERNELRKQLEGLEKPEAPEEPREEDFDSFSEFLKARQDWQIENFKTQSGAEQQQQQITAREQAVRQQQEQLIAEDVTELVNNSPEIREIFQKNAPLIDQMPPHVVEMVYQLDDPIAATVALAKEGRLAEVYNMHPQYLALELYNAQQRGVPMVRGGKGQPQPAGPAAQPQGPTSKAPQPMPASKGRGKTVNSPLELSDKEFSKWLGG